MNLLTLLTQCLSGAGAGAEARVVPADMLLLAGTCIVEEAVLTGESHPQWKTPVGNLGAKAGVPQHGCDHGA